LVSDSGEELEVRDIIEAFCNIFYMIDWCCVVGLVMAYSATTNNVKPAIDSKRSNSKDKKEVELVKGKDLTQNKYFLISLML